MTRQIIPAVIIIISIAGAFLYVWPGYKEINSLRAKEAVLDNGLGDAKEADEIGSSLGKTLASISEAEYRMLDRVLPKTIDTLRLSNDIQGIAANHGIDLGNIKAEESASSENETTNTEFDQQAPILQVAKVKKAEVSFEVTTTYEVFRNFIEDLQDSLQLFDIIAIKLTQNDEGLYIFNLSLRTYSLPDETL